MPTYRVITLGCKVNHYESMQVEQLLRGMGYAPSDGADADVVVVNTCSVTSSAAAKSRNILRRFAGRPRTPGEPPRTIAIGCWATSDKAQARDILGENAIIGHDRSVAEELPKLLASSQYEAPNVPPSPPFVGRPSLPILHHRQPANQRAVLKVQDGCDAHCTYCIIPKLRPTLWSRPADEVVVESRNMVAAGHHEIVLTGVFLGAYGQNTALHRRQNSPAAGLADLVEKLCTEVPGMLRLRLSSLEPGDLTPAFIARLKALPQVMPHFHLPLQSGSESILRRMNRQYSAAAYLQMIERLKDTFDRPALTTDVIVGFPGESDDDFQRTLDVARAAEFLHIHAFPYSPREGTAAARWKKQAIPPQTAKERMGELAKLNAESSLRFRSRFVGETVEILVEHGSAADRTEARDDGDADVRQGRCERYFAVHFVAPPGAEPAGKLLRARIVQVTSGRTFGEVESSG